MRKLASIQKIKKISSIPDADRIVKLTVLGWQCVGQKDLYKEGELVCYFEVDSFLPLEPEFEFLKKSCSKRYMEKDGYRIKTVTMRGQVSQGLCMPLADIQAILARRGYTGEIGEDVDLTEALGVIKYDTDALEALQSGMKSGLPSGKRPSFVPLTDETRFQVLGGVLERHQDNEFYVTEKLDGSSISCYYKGGKFGVTSRNLDIRRPLKPTKFKIFVNNVVRTVFRAKPPYVFSSSDFWRGAEIMRVEEKLRNYCEKYGTELVLQGELVGPGIQKNKLKLPELRIAFYNVYSITGNRFYDFDEFLQVLGELGLPCVPLVSQLNLSSYTSFETPDAWQDALVNLAKGNSFLNNEVPREGVVIRPVKEIQDRSPKLPHNRLSFKVINPDFLLKYDL